ncbi:Nose resistant to fluoxetine protein 6 [Araneus ventricosus]|uniref:Nose resistant to fluoxetine protein 6 n=1 Tax=Araneus ventricosus TaxID=182803 RepID=A0A4Y2F8N1_ARAVE|nr:Nose resistant to fluoxetine protein 6 [Araneus ventricosus]
MKSMRVLSLALGALCCILLMLEFSDGAVVTKKIEAVEKDDRIESLAEAEKRLKKLVNSGFKIALPYLMTIVTETRLSRNCLQGLLRLVKGVMDIRDWAIKMLDALGKPSAGLLEGTPTAMGDYDECLDIVVPRRTRPTPVPPYTEKQIAFYGQYCVVEIELPEAIKQAAMDYQIGNRSNSELANSKTFLRNLVKIAPRADVAAFRLGVCLPSLCSMDDLQLIIKEGLLIFGGTALEVYFRFTKTEPIDDVYIQKTNIWVQSMLAFSVPRNTRKLFSLTSIETSKIGVVRGMKIFSICIYILVWTYATPQDYHFFKFRNAFSFFKFFEQWWFTVLANASAGVDSIFLLAGFQLAYNYWKNSRTQRITVNAAKFLLKWYSRFTLSQILVITLLLLLPLVGSGPIWDDVVDPTIKNCKQRWWLNLLGLNNFWPSDTTCLAHTWLICCMFHLFLISPILIFILSRSTTVGVFVNCILIMGSSVAIAMVTLMNDLPPTPAFYFMSFVNIKSIWQKVFIQAYDHIGPFCIGILLGFFLTRYEKLKVNKIVVCVGWLFAAALSLSVLCGLYGYHHGEIMEMTRSAVYASLHRSVWSLGIAWIIFACYYGYGGIVNTILSWEYLIPLDRLAVLLYVLHPLAMFLHEGTLREKMYMGHLDQAIYTTAYIVFTVALAAVCYITCAAPFMFFEKKMWYEPEPTPMIGDPESPSEKTKRCICEKPHSSSSIMDEMENPKLKIKDCIRDKIETQKKRLRFFRQSVTITPR